MFIHELDSKFTDDELNEAIKYIVKELDTDETGTLSKAQVFKPTWGKVCCFLM